MASPARSTILQGPATLTYRGTTFHSKGDVELTINSETFEIASSTSGKMDERHLDTSVEVSFTPSGEFNDLTHLWPYDGTTVVGASIFGGYPLVIYPATGNKVTVLDAAVIEQPDIILSPDKTMIGQVKFFGIRSDTVEMSTTESIFSISAVGTPTLTAEDASLILTEGATGGYTLSTGSPRTDLDTEDGWVVSFTQSFSDVKTDLYGLLDKRYQKSDVMAKAKIYNMTEAEMSKITRMSTGQFATLPKRGASMNAFGVDLVLTGHISGIHFVTLNKCFVKSGGLTWSNQNKRMREVEFHATRTGLGSALFTLANS